MSFLLLRKDSLLTFRCVVINSLYIHIYMGIHISIVYYYYTLLYTYSNMGIMVFKSVTHLIYSFVSCFFSLKFIYLAFLCQQNFFEISNNKVLHFILMIYHHPYNQFLLNSFVIATFFQCPI